MRSKLFALWLLAFSFVPGPFAQTGISPPDDRYDGSAGGFTVESRFEEIA